MNGLGYTDDYGSTWKTALLMDGTFNTDRIAAGAIHGSKITANSLQLVTTAGETKCTISLKDSNGRVVASAKDIQINGMVTFTNLSDPNATHDGSATFIDGAHIKTGTIDADVLKVKTVYYTENDVNYEIVSSALDNGNMFMRIGPKDGIPTRYSSQYINMFANYISINTPVGTDDLLHTNGSLLIQPTYRRIFPYWTSSSYNWNIGDIDYPFKNMYAQYVHGIEHYLDLDNGERYGYIDGTAYGPRWIDTDGRGHYLSYQ